MTCSLYCRTRKFLMVVYHYGRKQWQYYHIEISSRKFFSKLSANVFNENLKRNTSTNKLVFNAVFTRFLNLGKRSLAIFDSDDKIFFPVFFVFVLCLFSFARLRIRRFSFRPKLIFLFYVQYISLLHYFSIISSPLSSNLSPILVGSLNGSAIISNCYCTGSTPR